MENSYPNHSELLHFSLAEQEALCERLRADILNVVSQTGGHLASSLGAVELCVALHCHFDLAGRDRVFFDVGHQAYAHKLLTGRAESFRRLRHVDGCSGFPCPAESAADPAAAGHAGVAMSQALGACQALRMQKKPGRVVAVVGDGALSCGISWEAMNNLQNGGRRLVVILNDNQMSISPNTGTIRLWLNSFITGNFYSRVREALRPTTQKKSFLRRVLRRLEHSLKGLFLPKGILFQRLGFRYFGPIDGNNLKELHAVLAHLPENRPVLLHVVTRKGRGYLPAEKNPEAFHGVSSFNRETGELPTPAPDAPPAYSQACVSALTALAEQHDDIVAITAAMLSGTGLKPFAKRFPARCFDTGIAEAHTVAFASGLAIQGMRPVVFLYSTFLQRALDNIYHDVCLNNLPVIFCVDRTGTVVDGPTHHGIYSLPFLRRLPNLTILAPADAADFEHMLAYAYSLKTPCILRYPRGTCIRTFEEHGLTPPPVESGKAWCLRGNDSSATLTLWAAGADLARAWRIADSLEQRDSSIHVRIVNPRFFLPFDTATVREYANTPQVVIDDYTEDGGLAAILREALAELPTHAPLWVYAWPAHSIIGYGTPAELQTHYARRDDDIVKNILKRLAHDEV